MTQFSNENPQQLFAAAMQHHQAGQLPQAQVLYRRILAQWPNHADALHALAILAAQVGKQEAALELFQRAVALNPGHPIYRSNLGETYRKLGRPQEAETEFRAAIAADPRFADASTNYSVLLSDQSRYAEAEKILHTAITHNPAHPPTWRMLGDVLVKLDRREEAIAAFEEALRLNPHFHEARFNYAVALLRMGRNADALAQKDRLLAAMPRDVPLRILLASAYAQANQLQLAVNEYLEAIRLDPALAEAHGGLANTLRAGDRLDEAISYYQQALALAPNDAFIHGNFAFALRDQARLSEAVAQLRTALEKEPQNAAAHSALIFTMHLDPAIPPAAIAAEKEKWNRLHVDPHLAGIPPHQNNRSPDRRLRIGYVSADLREHPVGRFMQPLLAHHDRSQVEIFCYSATQSPDTATDALRAASDHWRTIAATADEAAAEIIRADRIDILIDLCNHTTSNHLSLFARKPAPVQITYLAYSAGTGLRTMDWRLSDPFIDPPELEPPPLGDPAKNLLGERPLRMAETFWCYAASPDAGEVSPLPADKNAGRITFGSLNHFSKLNEQVLSLWAQLLTALRESRLLIHAPTGSRQPYVRSFFTDRGIHPDRLTIVPRQMPALYFAQYSAADIALDPFPWAGGTTSCDALWMGVPVLTLAGVRAEETLSRGGASLLSNLGLSEWITHSPEEYLAQARRAADNLPALRSLRSSLRQRMIASPLMNPSRFARHMESAFRSAWKRWCESPS